eukprot:gnl/TRDRNA2_/TRDRNA2_196048_c0_seq1.p1 gnl/TRDRNA2_/TRDRNA2_196048_c0~~gnl/TRDRNA2_/TRDRNA2_196048_c0_seq1.p1  ORF type:complete len:231 (+),score=39.77 gnl/TRDRNA2_/TRDRNA2_196048_c0_seq1:66-695(+)
MAAAAMDDPAAAAVGTGIAVGQLTKHEMMGLHRELRAWIKRTHYQPDELERRPVKQMRNTSFALASGAAAVTYWGQMRLLPWIGLSRRGMLLRLPGSLCLPASVFCFLLKPIQLMQLPGFTRDILTLPTPLGMKARETLEILRGQIPAAHAAQAHLSAPTALPDFWSTDDNFELGSDAWLGCQEAREIYKMPRRTTWEEIRARHRAHHS